MLIHASSVAIGKRAVLLAGASDVGKSDLALRLIDHGAQLIADDQTFLERRGEGLFASAPDSIKGMIEVRHVGLTRMIYTTSVLVALYVELVGPEVELERLPEEYFINFLDVRVRHIRLPGYAASTPAKIRALLKT